MPTLPHRFVLLLAFSSGAAAALSGCLEANAAPADGGATGADVATKAGDAGSPSHPSDATTAKDAGAVDATHADAGPDATTIAVIPTCKGATSGELACVTCDESSCASTVSTAVSACADFYTCFQACDCSDATCVNACGTMVTTSCGDALMALESCQKGMCATPCATPTTDAGPATDASSSSCTDPTATQLACASCDESSCSADLSATESQCGAFYACLPSCACSDMSCIDNCATGASSGCTSALMTLNDCQTSMCAGPCSGATVDGGAAPMVPDCADPTTAESSLYSACSACDAMHCQTDVTSAVADCGAYYACYAACACGDFFCEDDCDVDLNATCDAAIDALASCQTTNCSTPCSGE